MLTIKELTIKGYRKVIEAVDSDVGLHCFVAIHDSSLGPALGGMRIKAYPETQDALNDVLRLAQAMTYKSALAEDGLGGGKSVIIAQQKDKTKQLLLSFAKVIDSLGGEYIVAEDVGSTPEDLAIIRTVTPYVAALASKESSGDPSRFTAWGVFRGIQAVAYKLWGNASLNKRKIAVQGLGSVGSKLANILFWEGADLILCDLDEKKVLELASLYGAATVLPEDFCSVDCDILVPCALGGIINEKTIRELNCLAIAGAANNQLEKAENGFDLLKRNVLYAPDYIVNSGGIINAAAEFDSEGYSPKRSRDKVNHIYDVLLEVLERAIIENKPPNVIADQIAEYNLMHGIGRREGPIIFKRLGAEVL